MLDDLIHLVAKYFYLLVFSTRAQLSTVPALDLEKRFYYHKRGIDISDILKTRKSEAWQLRKLEIITNAMERERSHPRHGSLYDSFSSYIAPRKKELQDLYEQGLVCSILTDLNGRAGITHVRERNFRYFYDLRVFEELGT